jgi:hypothetical protein
MSKYHYYGIRVKPGSDLKLVHDTSDSQPYPVTGKKRKTMEEVKYHLLEITRSIIGKVLHHWKTTSTCEYDYLWEIL